MSYVITLIADRLDAALVDDMAGQLGAQGVSWLQEGVACDLFVERETWNVEREIETFFATYHVPRTTIDTIIQPAEGRRKKLLIADMESTIITCECLDELAELFGIREKIAAITARAMNGELDFEAALRERVGLLKGMPESALQRIMDEKVRLMPGAKELVSTMKKNGAYCMLVSGGFDFYASRVASMLGFDEWRANKLEILPPFTGGDKEGGSFPHPASPASGGGVLSGRVIPPVLGKEAKLEALNDACKRLGITPEETLAVGDVANDLPMLLAAGLGVAYHAKPNVRAQAKHRIDHADLRALLWAQGY